MLRLRFGAGESGGAHLQVRLRPGMNAHWGTLAALALAASLSGCAKPAPPPPPASPPPPQFTPEQIDGVYRGTSTRFQADSRACPSPGLIVLRVVNGGFQYHWNGRTELDATISTNGDVQGELGAISLSGKLEGDRIEGNASNETCAYHFRAVKRPH